MDLSCSQVEMLLSFYFDGELKENLRAKVEEHLEVCPTCKEKYRILTELLTGLREGVAEVAMRQNFGDTTVLPDTGEKVQSDYKESLSAYVDNELDDEENIRVKKLTINNKKARKYLEDSYALKHVLKSAYDKSLSEMKKDYTKNVLSSLDLEGQEYTLNPFVKVLAILSAIALFGTIFIAIALNVAW